MKSCWGCGGIALTILDFGTGWRWVVSFTPRPLYSQGNILRYPLDRKLGGPQSRSGWGGEEINSHPPVGIRTPDHPARSPALYHGAIPATVSCVVGGGGYKFYFGSCWSRTASIYLQANFNHFVQFLEWISDRKMSCGILNCQLRILHHIHVYVYMRSEDSDADASAVGGRMHASRSSIPCVVHCAPVLTPTSWKTSRCVFLSEPVRSLWM
jgi:hypothetical protein